MIGPVVSPRRVVVALAVASTAGVLAVAVPGFAQTVGVSVGNYYFEDSTVGDGKVTARVGDQLRFTVIEGAGHTVTINALGIDSGQLAPGAVFVTPALSTPGTYSLICRTHLSRNHATTLVVLASSGGGGGGGTPTTTLPPGTTPTSSTSTTVAGGSTVSPGNTVSDPGAGGGTASTTAAIDGTPAGGTGNGDGQTADGGVTDDGLLPVGVVAGDSTPWLRAVWISLVTLPLFAGAALLADRSARRHARRRPDTWP